MVRERFEKALGGPAAARRGRFGVDVDHGKVARDHPQVDAAGIDHARRGARTHRRARGTTSEGVQGAGKEEVGRQVQEARCAAEGRRPDGAGEEGRGQEGADQESGGEKGGDKQQAQRLARPFSLSGESLTFGLPFRTAGTGPRRTFAAFG